jgi:plastin-1
MKAYILSKIGNKTEEELISWGNERVENDLKISSLKDKRLGNSLYFINIIKSIEPSSLNLNKIIKNKDDNESRKINAIYVISIARNLGVTIFLDWEDIIEVNSKLLLTFLAAIYQDLFLKN